MSRSDTTLAALLLAQRLIETPATPLKASEYWALLDTVPDPAALLGLGAEAVAEVARVDRSGAERIVQLLDASTAFAFALDDQAQSGIHAIASVDDDYPRALVARLGRGAPPMLYAVGDPSLLERPLLGIVGARDVSEEGAKVARAAAAEAVRNGLGIVSGGAKGVDRLAMGAALDAGGHAVGVLADSLVRAARDPDIRRAVIDGRLCLCTPYQPTTGFSVANAMGRNKVIYGLSSTTLVVTADAERGGTWAGAVEAIDREIAPTLVWTGAGLGAGNERLVALGATGVSTTDALFPLPHRPGRAGQLRFDV